MACVHENDIRATAFHARRDAALCGPRSVPQPVRHACVFENRAGGVEHVARAPSPARARSVVAASAVRRFDDLDLHHASFGEKKRAVASGFGCAVVVEDGDEEFQHELA